MSFLYGRYLLAGVWAAALFSVPLSENPFIPASSYVPDQTADPAFLQVIQKKVDQYFTPIA